MESQEDLVQVNREMDLLNSMPTPQLKPEISQDLDTSTRLDPPLETKKGGALLSKNGKVRFETYLLLA